MLQGNKFGRGDKWTAFVTALVVAYAVVGMQADRQWYDWLLAFFNACLLFCSALGVNTCTSGNAAIAVALGEVGHNVPDVRVLPAGRGEFVIEFTSGMMDFHGGNARPAHRRATRAAPAAVSPVAVGP